MSTPQVGLRVYISVDMEGVAGVVSDSQCSKGGSDYPAAQRLMTAEASAAVAGAFDAGATEVLVNDSHGDMLNLLAGELDPRALLLSGRPKSGSMCAGLESGFAVALFVGYHTGPAVAGGVLGHTYSGAAYHDLRLNGRTVSETELNALYAASLGVPVGLVSGDEATCATATELLPQVEVVAVKRGLGLTAAASLHPDRAREAIHRGSEAAVARAHDLPRMTIPATLDLEAVFHSGNGAFRAALVPGSERIAERVVRRSASDPRQLVDLVSAWAYLGDINQRG